MCTAACMCASLHAIACCLCALDEVSSMPIDMHVCMPVDFRMASAALHKHHNIVVHAHHVHTMCILYQSWFTAC